MRILEINIQNFRKLLQCHIEFSEKTTLFVGANNSGKTSAMDALGKFLADRNFTFNDITISERSAINVIGERWIQKDCEEPTTITEWESLMPKMDIWLNVASRSSVDDQKQQSDTDEKNAHDGKDTSITRTARLFYVACTRAKKSLAIVAYTENEEMVRDTALANGWFLENEIYIV